MKDTPKRSNVSNKNYHALNHENQENI